VTVLNHAKQESSLELKSQDDSFSEPITMGSEDQDLEYLVSTYIGGIYTKKLKPFIGL
jgi:hypothetical protein